MTKGTARSARIRARQSRSDPRDLAHVGNAHLSDALTGVRQSSKKSAGPRGGGKMKFARWAGGMSREVNNCACGATPVIKHNVNKVVISCPAGCSDVSSGAKFGMEDAEDKGVARWNKLQEYTNE